MKELDNCRRIISSLTSKISNLEIIKDEEVKCEFIANEKEYEELMIWGNLGE